jgi:hypothetical protein
MQNVFVSAQEFVDHMKQYVNNRITSVKLQVAERSSKLLSDIAAVIIIAAMMLVFMIFLSMAAAYALSELIGENFSGFLVVAGMWLLAAIFTWANREKMLRIPIMNKMLKQMFCDEEDS